MGFTNPYPASRLTVDSTNSLANGLVGFWPLTDGGSSTTAKDITSNANDGTQSGGVSWASTAIGTAASFDGSNDYFDLGDNYDFGDGTTDSAFSISGWIYLDTLPAANKSHVVLSKTSESSSTTSVSSYLLGVNSSGELGFRLYDESGGNQIRALSAASSFSTGQWYHLAGTYTGSGSPTGLQVYINGVNAVNSQSVAGTYVAMHNSTETAKIGCTFLNNATYESFNDGYIQNVRVYNRALSATEVATLYNRPWEGTSYGDLWPYSPPAPADATLSTDTAATSLMSGCIGWWPLTDGSGSTATDIVGTNNGTDNGGVSWASSGIGTVASFDGVDDYFAFGTFSSFFPGPSITGSISGWVKWSSGRTIMIGGQATSNERLYIGVENGKWDVGFGNYPWNGNYTGTLVAAVSGEWAHVVVSISSGVAKLYVNGSETITKTADTSVSLGGQFSIGAYIGPSGITALHTDPCEIQNVRAYNRALSQDEITTLYERPWEGIEYGDAFHYDPPTPANLTPLTSDSINNSQIGWWPLTETDDYASGAEDISGNGKTLTKTGTVTSAVSGLGGTADFDGSGDYLQNTTVTTSSFPWTLSAWGYYSGDGTSRDTLLSLGCSSSDTPYCYIFFDNTAGTAAGQTRCSATGFPTQTITSSITTGEWYHLVWVQNSQVSSEFYINGASVGTDTTNLNSAPTPALNQVQAGILDRTTAINDMLGRVHNCRLWNRVLTDEEIWSIYQNPWLGSAYTATAAEVLYNYIFRSKRFRRLS